MSNPIDKRGILAEKVFTYKITKDKKVFISYYGKQVTTLSGADFSTLNEEAARLNVRKAELEEMIAMTPGLLLPSL